MISVGVDTHLKTHQVEVQNEKRQVMWRGQIGNNRKGFNELLEKLRTIERSNGDSAKGIYINPTGTYHLPIQHFLESNGYRVFYVDARVTESARMTENLGKVKSDKVDAHLLASSPWEHSEACKKPHIRNDASGVTRLLESVKKNVTRIINLMSADLACVFPEFMEFFQDTSSKTSMAILDRYAIPQNIVDSGMENLLEIMQKSSRHHYGSEDAERLFHLAMDSIGIPDASGAYAFRIRENVKRLRAELKVIDEIEAKILYATKDNDDVKRIDDIRGIGTMNAATIVSEIGPIGQFESALKLQSFGGKAPKMKGSGGKDYAMGLSRVRNPHLSNAIYESSISLVKHNNREFLEMFNREITRGKKPVQAYIVVGRRLLYHIYSIMKNQKPYRQRLRREGVTSTAG